MAQVSSSTCRRRTGLGSGHPPHSLLAAALLTIALFAALPLWLASNSTRI